MYRCVTHYSTCTLTQMLFRPYCVVWSKNVIANNNVTTKEPPPSSIPASGIQRSLLLHIAYICIYSFATKLICVSKCVCVFFHYNCPRKNCKCAIIKQLLSCILYYIVGLNARGGGGGDIGYNVRRGFTIPTRLRPHYYNIISCARCRQTMTRYNNNDIILLRSNEILRGFACLLSIYKSHSDGIKCHGTRSSADYRVSLNWFSISI